jgi:FKBP-type peptidyl-prolyl cis-trans isomerase FklB
MSLFDKLRQATDTKSKATAEAGEAFMKANALKPGVVEIPGGIQYEVLTEGSGAKPGPTSVVTCHYHGTLIDGTVFDSSVKRGAPASFPLNGVIKGWTEALQLMSLGSKWRLFLPPSMAYGDRQVSSIPANSTLIFEVELLGIK